MLVTFLQLVAVAFVSFVAGFGIGRLEGSVKAAIRRLEVLDALREQPERTAYANHLGLGGWVYMVLRDLEREGFVERLVDPEPSVPGTTVRRVRWRLRA